MAPGVDSPDWKKDPADRVEVLARLYWCSIEPDLVEWPDCLEWAADAVAEMDAFAANRAASTNHLRTPPATP